MTGKVRKHFSHLLERVNKFFDFQSVKSIGIRAIKLSLANVAGIVLLFFTNYLIIHLAGEQAYGNFSIINVWVNFFVVIVIFGFDDLFIAAIPKLNNSKAALYALLQKAFKISLVVFLVVALVVFFLLYLKLLPPVLAEYKTFFFIQLAVLSILTLLLCFFRGLNSILIGQLFDKIIRPLIVLLCIFFYYLFQTHLTLQSILSFQIIALFVPALLLLFLLRINLAKKSLVVSKDSTSLKSNITFLAISLLYLLSTRLDLLMLSGRMAPQEVGYYNIAARLADFVGYPLAAITLIVHTLLAKEYQVRKNKSIYRHVMQIAAFTFFTTAVIFLFVFFFGKNILLFFGERFVMSFTPLLILSASHLLYSLALPFNALLMVNGNERFSLLALAANVLVTFLLAYVLLPLYASRGAAFAVLGGSCINLLATIFIIYRLHLQHKQ